MTSVVYNFPKNRRINRLTDALFLVLRIVEGSQLVALIGDEGDSSNRQAVSSWVAKQFSEIEMLSDQDAFAVLKLQLEKELIDFIEGV